MFNRFSGSNLNAQPQPSTLSNPSAFYNVTPSSSTPSPFSSNPFNSQSSQSIPLPSTPSVPYCLTNDIENGVSVKLLAVSAMPAYRHLSQEEIRVEDYLKGRKGPSGYPGSKSGAFSQPFSTTSTPTTSYNKPSTNSGFSGSSSLFGNGGAFGNTSTGGFGTTSTPSTSAFGGLSSSNPFGASPPATTFGTANTNTSGGFGTSSNVFGGAPSTGAFGQTPQLAQSTNIFGSTPSTGIFGQQQQPATSGFGGFGTNSTATTTNPFAAKPSAASTGLFGSSAFGVSNSTTPVASATTPFGGGFGSNNTNTNTNPFGNSFGQSQSQSQSQPQPQAQPQQSQSFGIFSQPQSQTQVQNPSNSFAPSTAASGNINNLFGGTGSGGMFGSSTNLPTSTSTAQTGGGGMFGSNTFGSTPASSSSTGLFGSQPQQQQQQQPQSTGFSFGQVPTQAQPQSTGLFGSSNAPGQSSGLFGGSAPNFSSTNIQRPALTGSSLSTPSTSIFGNGIGTGSTSMFNRPTTSNTVGGGLGTSSTSMFSLPSSIGTTSGLGGSMQQSQGQTQGQGQQISTAFNFPTVSSAPLGSSSLTPPIPLNQISSSSSQVQVQAQAQAQVPRSPVKFTPRTSFRIKPREAYNLTTPIPLNFNLTSASTSSGSSTVLVPRKLAGTSNIKKLVIPDFNDDCNYQSNDETNNQIFTQTPLKTNQFQSSFSSSVGIVTNNSNILTDSMTFGQQYTFPPLKVLNSLKPVERSEIKNFIIGQKGIGEIRFLLPVNLSEIDPDQIFGHFVEFCEGEAVLYPDPTISKPQPGQGLNLPAQVRLERIWTISKGSRDPIVDPKNEKVVHFIQKLKETPGTNFVSYDPETGAWTFTVDHF